jgi:hypothetical protein
MSAVTVKKYQISVTGQDLLPKIPSGKTKANIFQNSLFISLKKTNKSFLILPLTALFLLILGGTVWGVLILYKTYAEETFLIYVLCARVQHQ